MAEGFYITNAGLKKITLAVSRGEKVDINAVAVGSGGSLESERDYGIEGLVSEVYRKYFEEGDTYDVDPENDNTIIIDFIIPDDAGFIENINEAGFFDSEGTLICYGCLQSITKRVGQNGNKYRVSIAVYIPFTNDDLDYINLVIGTDGLRELERRVALLESELDTTQLDVEDIKESLNDYVRKEDGKGLSTYDFTEYYRSQITTNKESIESLQRNFTNYVEVDTFNRLESRVKNNENEIAQLKKDLATKASTSDVNDLRDQLSSLRSSVNTSASDSDLLALQKRVQKLEDILLGLESTLEYLI